MARTADAPARTMTLSRAEAALAGLMAGGCRLLFASPSAMALQGDVLLRLSRRLARAGGAMVQAQSDAAAACMAAGAAIRGAKAAAVVGDAPPADAALSGLDDLTPVLIDVSGRVPLTLSHVRGMMVPHTTQSAHDIGRGAFSMAGVLHGPHLIAGTDGQMGELWQVDGDDLATLPIHHAGPDDPAVLLVGAGGPTFQSCARARERLEAEGMAAAHLHLLQMAPFPGAIIAPALTSARRVLVVEPGGPGTLSGFIRSHLGAPAVPFGELPRLGTPPSAEEIAWRAREVSAL